MEEEMINLVMAEFGAERQNAGGASLLDRLEPTLSSMRKYFPDMDVTVFSDHWLKVPTGVTLAIAKPPFDPGHPRYGWRCNDYYKVYGLLKTRCPVAIAMDSDMVVVSPEVQCLPKLAEKFGLCLPMNGRLTVRKDARSLDGDTVHDPSQGLGMAYNMSPIAYQRGNANAMILLSIYLSIMEQTPMRGPLAMWHAAWKCGFAPYVLPPQWCLCAGQEGIGDEVILHVGHPSVAKHYGVDL